MGGGECPIRRIRPFHLEAPVTLGRSAVALFALVTQLWLLGCQSRPGGEAEPQNRPGAPATASALSSAAPARTGLVVKSYDLPAGLAPEVAALVNRLLKRGDAEPPVGTAEPGASGKLVVAAPAEVQSGVEEIVAQYKDAKPSPPAEIEITYWVVTAKPSDKPDLPENLKEIAPALEALSTGAGPRTFDLLEKQRLASVSGEGAKVRGRYFEIAQVATGRDGKAVAQVGVKGLDLKASLETKLTLPAGELMILGESALESQKATPNLTVIYVARARVSP